MGAVHGIVGHHVAVVADPRDVRDEIECSHVAISRAIAAGRSATSRELMENHVRTVATFSAQPIGPQTKDLIEWRERPVRTDAATEPRSVGPSRWFSRRGRASTPR